MLDYAKLFFEIRESPFVKEYPIADGGILKLYYADQKSEKAGKPTLVRTLKKGGGGKEVLYRPNGHSILEVGLKHGRPYGRAKMFDENGVRIFPNTYWFYGIEIKHSYDYFSKLETEEKKLIEEENKALKENKDKNKIAMIQKRYTNRRNKIYDPKDIGIILKYEANILFLERFEKKSLFKKYFGKER